MSVPPATIFNIERLRRYDGPQYFLGGGFLAGLLIFLVWLSMLPDHDRHALRARGNGVAGANAMAAPGRGVLGDITGGARGAVGDDAGGDSYFFNEGGDEADPDAESTLAPDPAFDQQELQDADAMAVGEEIGSHPYPESGALTDSLLDAPAPPEQATSAEAPEPPPPSVPGAALRPWFVEVEVAPGQVQMLQLNAESAEHALAILRDFRGDPRVLRGPSPEPLP